MLVEAVFLSILIGKLRGYKMKSLERATIKKWWLIIISISFEFISSIIIKNEFLPFSAILSNNYLFVQLFVYAFLFIFICYNLYSKSFYLVLLGSFLNFVVIIMNKGFMPVSTKIAATMGFDKSIKLLESGRVAGHTILAKGVTKLWFLGDIINIPPPYPFPQSVSIGDIFISIGVFLFIQNIMEKHS